jgi:hypothetical protein
MRVKIEYVLSSLGDEIRRGDELFAKWKPIETNPQTVAEVLMGKELVAVGKILDLRMTTDRFDFGRVHLSIEGVLYGTHYGIKRFSPELIPSPMPVIEAGGMPVSFVMEECL